MEGRTVDMKDSSSSSGYVGSSDMADIPKVMEDDPSYIIVDGLKNPAVDDVKDAAADRTGGLEDPVDVKDVAEAMKKKNRAMRNKNKLNYMCNFGKYSASGIVPAVQKNSFYESFYKSVHYIDSVIGPVKDVMFGVYLYDSNYLVNRNKKHLLPCLTYDTGYYIGHRKNPIPRSSSLCRSAISLSLKIALHPLYLVFAYLSYLPVKWLTKVSGTESLVNYANKLSHHAEFCSSEVAKYISIILSGIFTAIVWVAALVITPLVCACKWTKDKVAGASKFTEVEKPEELKINDTVDGNAASKLTEAEVEETQKLKSNHTVDNDKARTKAA